MPRDASDLLHGTLDVLVLKALSLGPLHGYAVSEWIEGHGDGDLVIVDAALYKALHRLEDGGAIEAEWGVSENNRKAKYYSLTPARTRAAARRDRDVAALRERGRQDSRGHLIHASPSDRRPARLSASVHGGPARARPRRGGRVSRRAARRAAHRRGRAVRRSARRGAATIRGRRRSANLLSRHREGAHAADAHGRTSGEHDAGRSRRGSTNEEVAGLLVRGGVDARPRHRRDDGAVQRRERRASQSAAVPGARPHRAGHRVEREG